MGPFAASGERGGGCTRRLRPASEGKRLRCTMAAAAIKGYRVLAVPLNYRDAQHLLYVKEHNDKCVKRRPMRLRCVHALTVHT